VKEAKKKGREREKGRQRTGIELERYRGKKEYNKRDIENQAKSYSV
jgi:hypothetical protein